MKNGFNNKSLLKVLFQNVELTGAPNISFTGDAIAHCGPYLKDATHLNLDEWEWYKEMRGGEEFYIITNLKRAMH
ncbi:hypothetical protein A8C56_07755 [Niabella ginsenosidivorans]|uniref:Uncharacterized protein n=1 Tax=Niabella ginsenosidivorans TaxID=1176587 RepID=A0A1A9HZP7_9BACT|nr:hypothetical protein [Niabella ginsenosidivorans]ANH80887.1 hypothetical protein A8C56_07755 [Niabella ginsenosidivorans]